MAEALLDLEIAELRRHLRAAISGRAESLFIVLRRHRETRTALGAEVLALLDALGDRYDPVALHRLRSRVRRLRYLAEVGDIFRGQSSVAAESLKALQDQLGLVQDTHVLAAWVGRQATSAQARGQAELAREAPVPPRVLPRGQPRPPPGLPREGPRGGDPARTGGHVRVPHGGVRARIAGCG